MRQHIAVIDIGKTNAKLALVDGASLAEMAVTTCENTVLAGPPYPHFDLGRIWQFLKESIADFQARYGIDAISITTHGAACVLLDGQGNLTAPMLDYEHDGPDFVAAQYDALRPDFAQTGSPRLPLGLNLGAQLFWQFSRDPSLLARTAQIVTYPQYWGYLLTGNTACDPCSLGCHTDLWNPHTGAPSALVKRLGIAHKLAPVRAPFDVLGTVKPDLAQALGLPAATPVHVGIHDSNASLLPHVLGQAAPFGVVSTGTWVIVMAMRARPMPLDPARDTLINVNALGAAVPSARFMGGREYEMLAAPNMPIPTAKDIAQVLANGAALLPAVVPSAGPFQGHAARWIGPEIAQGTPAHSAAVALYLAMMTLTCLDLIGQKGPVIIEGPFAQNHAYVQMLAAISGMPVRIAASQTGTSAGAALLALAGALPAQSLAEIPKPDWPLAAAYFEQWQAALAPN